MDFSEELINWYHNNRRELPWRNTTDAYVIWLSEIILQQTRVEQGLPYFYRFLDNYPTVNSFAAAGEEEILKLWQGLGYYSRGRNMLKTAIMVSEMFNGQFPTRYDDLIKLKGIGEYTAAAISSFSANEARAVVDGNVYRVLSRFFGISEAIDSTSGKKSFQKTADEFLNKQMPAMHNQAMMELGALICKPRNPACNSCPLQTGCYAYANHAISELPVKSKKVNVRKRFFNYFLVTNGDTILMRKRGEGDIWANMYDLPLIETPAETTTDELLSLPETLSTFGDELVVTRVYPTVKHVLTHQHLYIRFIVLGKQPDKMAINWVILKVKELKKTPLSKVIFLFLDNYLN